MQISSFIDVELEDLQLKLIEIKFLKRRKLQIKAIKSKTFIYDNLHGHKDFEKYILQLILIHTISEEEINSKRTA